MKRFLSLMVALLLSAAISLPAQAGGSGILVDGRALAFDVEPQVIDGVLMVPIRAVAEAMQGEVSWDESRQAAIVASGERTVAFTVGSDTAQMNGRSVLLSGKVAKVGNRTFVPASFLLLFYGSRLEITHPAVRDPRAIDLLLKSVAAPPTHYDTNVTQQVHLTDGVVTVDMTAESQAQVRGEDLLMTTRVKSLMLPPGTGDHTVAIRDGKQFVKADGVWQQMPGEPDPSAMQGQLSPTGEIKSREVMERLILEAHMGETRTVDGRQLQDIVVTYDMNRLFSLLGDLMPKEATQSDFTFERYTTVITVDMATGATVAQKVDMALLSTVEGRAMRIELQMDTTLTPSTAPIAWPADME